MATQNVLMSLFSLGCVIGLLSLLHRGMLAAEAKLKLLSQILAISWGWQCYGNVCRIDRIVKPILLKSKKNGADSWE